MNFVSPSSGPYYICGKCNEVKIPTYDQILKEKDNLE